MHLSIIIGEKIPFFLLLLLLVSFSTLSESAKVTEYNYTFDLPSAKLKDLSSREDNQTFSGQVLKQFLIKEPKQIGDVFKIVVRLNFEDHIIPTNVNESSLLSTPSVEGLWYSSYVWPVKKKSITYFLQNDQGLIGEQKPYIISAAYVSTTTQSFLSNVLSEELQIYTLLSTGQIQWILKSHQSLKVQKIYDFQSASNVEKEWAEQKLYFKNEKLYLLSNQNFYPLSFNEIDNGDQKKTFYRFFDEKAINSVKKVVQTPQSLYIFTDKICYSIQGKEPTVIVTYENIIQNLPQAKRGFIDFAVFDNSFYFLVQQLGLIKLESSKYSLIHIQHPQYAHKVDVYNNTILITYEINDDDFIQQYQLVQSQGKVFINKIYNHHSEENVQNIIMFDKGMIINRGSEILFGFHSLNRNFPDAFHQQGSIIEPRSFNTEVMDLKPVQSLALDLLGYMIVTDSSIELIQFQSQSRNHLQQKWITITSQIKGMYNFDIQFIGKNIQNQGTCKNSQFYRSQYCSMTKTLLVQVNDSTADLIHSWWFWLCIPVVTILLFLIVFGVLCKYFAKKQNLFESLMQQSSLRKNQSSVMEMSMENNSYLK